MFSWNGQAEQDRRVLGEREEGIAKVHLPPSAARKKHRKKHMVGSADMGP